MFFIPQNSVEVKNTKEKGKGVFAKKDIKPGIVIGDYLGTVMKTAEALLPDGKENFYLMYYHDQASIFPDLKIPGIHLLNHSCTPNCWMYTYKGHTLFFALRKIFKGEELTISYLLGPKDPYCTMCTHLCFCCSFFCTKSMHLSQNLYSQWALFHDKQIKQTKKKRIRYGKTLAKLSSYPKTIADHPIYTLFGSDQAAPIVLRDTSLPSLQKVRKIIRDSGRTILLARLSRKILGVSEEQIVFQI